MAFKNFYKGRKVLVTGNTGFKGAWLSFWLKQLGAVVYGLALEPDTNPSLFEILQLTQDVKHCSIDIRNFERVKGYITEVKPEIVFHLAAQALVRRSYRLPLETLDTNFMGTAYLLQGIREAGYSGDSPCTVVIITSDKCYENRETFYAYREDDSMGGHDVYSMSKGAVELLVASCRRSFFPVKDISRHGISLASVRAGNVIGGGDWAEDRIVVDSIQALLQHETIRVRNPYSIRPWQHVLEPLSGYLEIAAEMGRARGKRPELLSAFNFGPGRDSERPVEELVELIITNWGNGEWRRLQEKQSVHEAHYLKLSTEKAWHILNWSPIWDFEASIRYTVSWYKEGYACHFAPETMRTFTTTQIEEYTDRAARQGVAWAQEE